jgi:hypothetical protein
MRLIKILFILSGFVMSTNSYAQGFFEHEFGVNAGFLQLRSDYGERFDNETNFGNSGATFGLSYYLNRASSRRANYFMEHVKYRIDLNFSSVDLQHYGRWSDDPLLEAMTGSFSNLALSTGIEYYPFGIRVQDFRGKYSFIESISPYAGIAVGLNNVTSKAETSLAGGLDNPANIFPTFIPTDSDNGLNTGTRTILSLNLRAGIRFDIGTRDGFIIESSWILYGSDLVDGLSPIGPQNKYTDWSWGINFGYSRLLF